MSQFYFLAAVLNKSVLSTPFDYVLEKTLWDAWWSAASPLHSQLPNLRLALSSSGAFSHIFLVAFGYPLVLLVIKERISVLLKERGKEIRRRDGDCLYLEVPCTLVLPYTPGKTRWKSPIGIFARSECLQDEWACVYWNNSVFYRISWIKSYAVSPSSFGSVSTLEIIICT